MSGSVRRSLVAEVRALLVESIDRACEEADRALLVGEDPGKYLDLLRIQRAGLEGFNEGVAHGLRVRGGIGVDAHDSPSVETRLGAENTGMQVEDTVGARPDTAAASSGDPVSGPEFGASGRREVADLVRDLSINFELLPRRRRGLFPALRRRRT